MIQQVQQYLLHNYSKLLTHNAVMNVITLLY